MVKLTVIDHVGSDPTHARVQRLHQVDRALRGIDRTQAVPDDLVRRIMCAVRAESRAGHTDGAPGAGGSP